VGALVATLTSNVRAGVVVPIRVGDTPSAGRILAPLLDELEGSDPYIIARASTLRTRLSSRPSRPGLAEHGLTVLALVDEINAGQKLWRAGKIAEAIEKLAPVIDKAHANPALLVDDEAHRDSMLTALVALAMSYAKRADDPRLPQRARDELRAKSEQTMAELVRSFPSRESAILDGFGSDATRLYKAAADRLSTEGHGTLVVRVDDPAALIFVNEWDHPSNSTFEGNVLPGVYRVLVKTPGTDGQLYAVEVAANQHAQLDVDAGFDDALTISDRFVGLSFASDTDARLRAVPYARRVSTMADSASRAVFVVQATMWNGKPCALGTIYDGETGARVRGKGVALDGHDDEPKLRRLARALRRADRVGDDSDVFDVPDPTEPKRAEPATASAEAQPSRAPELVLGGASVVALGLGGVVLYRSFADSCSGALCSKPVGASALLVGGALAAGALYFYLRRTSAPAHHPVAAVVPLGTGVLVSSAWSF
jgi:hypothetical protein